MPGHILNFELETAKSILEDTLQIIIFIVGNVASHTI